MRLLNFQAQAHAEGGRIDVSWEIHPDAGETLRETPPVVRVRRKARDFSFPPPGPGADPFLIYDGGSFSADVTLPPRYELEDGFQVTELVDADEEEGPNGKVQTPRRWLRLYREAGGGIHHLQVRIADRGGAESLTGGTTYYYQIFGAMIPAGVNPAAYRATAQATTHLGQADTLYRLLPGVHKRYDEKGELRRFLSIFGDQLDLIRSQAQALPALHDVDHVDYRFLPLLASWLGWDLNYTAAIPLRRHEIKYAAALYRITGTIPGCMIWVKRLSGWEANIKEFYKNVFFSNDLGNPDDVTDHGSRTVDTSDAEAMARVGTWQDTLDYTYDTGTGDEDWYAYNCVGLFVKPNPDETVDDVLRKRANLINNLSLFMPVNIRGVVILDLASLSPTHRRTLDLLAESDDEPPL